MGVRGPAELTGQRGYRHQVVASPPGLAGTRRHWAGSWYQNQQRFQAAGKDYAALTRVAAVAVNGDLINYRKGMKTKLADGDRVAFLKASAGG